MADVIPASNAELLAAQAKSGMDGVAAYKQAQQTLTDQRQSAVQQAMQEAALRGAPVGAAGSQQSIISAPYDQRLASLAQGQAGFEGAMAGRDRRMADYNAATLQARTLVPGEVEKVVAPIRAQGQATIANTTRQGEMAVSEIEANTRLALARMAAEAAAAARAAAAKAAKDKADAMKLSGTDATAMISKGTADKIAMSYNNAGKLLAENAARTGVDSGVVKNVNATDKALAAEKDRQRGNVPTDDAATTLKMLASNPLLAQLLPGGIGSALVGEAHKKYDRDVTAWYAAQPQQPGAATRPANQGSNQGVFNNGSQFMRPSQTKVINASGSVIPGGATLGTAEDRANLPAYAVPGGPGSVGWGTRPNNAGVSSTVPPRATSGPAPMKMIGSPPVSATDYLSSAKQAAALALSRQHNDAALTPLMGAQTSARDALTAERGKYSSEYGDIGLDQLKFINGTDPFLASLITNAPEKLTAQNIGRYIAGEPDAAGQTDPYAQNAVSLAQRLVRQDLEKQGYTISDQDFQNAVGNDMKPGETFAQYQHRSTGQLSDAELTSAGQKAFGDKVAYNKLTTQYDENGNPLTDENGVPMSYTGEQKNKAYDDLATQWITGTSGMQMPSGSSFGGPQDIMAAMQGGGDGATYVSAYNALANNSGGVGFNTNDWKDQLNKLKNSGASLTPIQVAMLKSIFYVPSLDNKN